MAIRRKTLVSRHILMVPGKASYLSGNVAGRSSPETYWATPPDHKKTFRIMSYVIETELKDVIVDLAKSLPNDQDLGKRFRSGNIFHGVSLEFPNDQDLGRELRKIYRSTKK